MRRFEFGDRIKPSAEGLKTFRNWNGRQGLIIGGSREGVWEIRWDGRSTIERIHESFIEIIASDKEPRPPHRVI